MIFRIKRALILVGLFLLSSIIFLFAVYGGIQFSTCSERVEMARLVETQQAEIANLELKVRELRRINSLIPILEQLLIPCQKDELEAGAEMVRQKRCKNYERFEQPLITEKERN